VAFVIFKDMPSVYAPILNRACSAREVILVLVFVAIFSIIYHSFLSPVTTHFVRQLFVAQVLLVFLRGNCSLFVPFAEQHSLCLLLLFAEVQLELVFVYECIEQRELPFELVLGNDNVVDK
jgi:hypothetical protein